MEGIKPFSFVSMVPGSASSEQFYSSKSKLAGLARFRCTLASRNDTRQHGKLTDHVRALSCLFRIIIHTVWRKWLRASSKHHAGQSKHCDIDYFPYFLTLYELISLLFIYMEKQNTRRYIDLFSRAIDELLPEPSKDISYKSDVHDVIMAHRREKNTLNEENDLSGFPPELLRR